MKKVWCFGSDDSLIEHMYQWDVNRTIKVKGGAIAENTSYEIHMGNRFMPQAFVVIPDIVDGMFVVNVPSKLLETPDTIHLFLYAEKDNEIHERLTIGIAYIKVIPRTKPATEVEQHEDQIVAVPDGFVLEDGKLYLAKGNMKIGIGTDIDSSGGGIVAVQVIWKVQTTPFGGILGYLPLE